MPSDPDLQAPEVNLSVMDVLRKPVSARRRRPSLPPGWPTHLTITFALFLTMPIPASAWGKAGHRVVAMVATTMLTEEAQAEVATLLDPGVTLADISTWADDIRPSP